jgi:hypothetical protein
MPTLIVTYRHIGGMSRVGTPERSGATGHLLKCDQICRPSRGDGRHATTNSVRP